MSALSNVGTVAARCTGRLTSPTRSFYGCAWRHICRSSHVRLLTRRHE
jgi:hypothetical protein